MPVTFNCVQPSVSLHDIQAVDLYRRGTSASNETDISPYLAVAFSSIMCQYPKPAVVRSTSTLMRDVGRTARPSRGNMSSDGGVRCVVLHMFLRAEDELFS